MGSGGGRKKEEGASKNERDEKRKVGKRGKEQGREAEKEERTVRG